jgi:hypothetical protein
MPSLRVLRDTLETVRIIGCRHVGGNLTDLADFPRLKELDVHKSDKRERGYSGHWRT